MKKLNLACGTDIKKGYINLDKFQKMGVDVIADFNKKLPFEDNYFDEIYAKDCLEHTKDIFVLIKELYRISKPGAKWFVKVPYWHCDQFANLDHHIRFGTDSFNFFDVNYARHYYSDITLRVDSVKLIPSRIGWLIPPIPFKKGKVKNLRHAASFIFSEIIVSLEFDIKVIK